jgi:NADPH:quinone reductase-like Zn-dependent oxidoreductase
MASASLPKTMKSVHQLDKHSARLTVDETPLPTPSHPEDHLIKVQATAPCLGELWWARDFPAIIPADKEPVPCSDLAGTVVWAPESSPYKPGDEVFARVDASRPGCAREYTLARQQELALKPKSLSWVQAAATPLSALTAWQGLFLHGSLDSSAISGNKEAKTENGKKQVLITGAGGAVGSWAIQFAAGAGIGSIVAVCSASKAEMVRKLGATEIVDYTSQSVAEWAAAHPAARECDLIFDCVGGETLKSCWGAAKEGGIFLSIVSAPDSVKPEDSSKTLAKSTWFLVEPLGSQLAEIAKLIDAGSYEVNIDSVHELEGIEKAFEIVEGKHAKGKVVVKVSA